MYFLVSCKWCQTILSHSHVKSYIQLAMRYLRDTHRGGVQFEKALSAHVCSSLCASHTGGGGGGHGADKFRGRTQQRPLGGRATSREGEQQENWSTASTHISRSDMARLDVLEMFHGIRFPGHLHTQDSLQLALEFPFEDPDILITSYPKSGERREQIHDKCLR